MACYQKNESKIISSNYSIARRLGINDIENNNIQFQRSHLTYRYEPKENILINGSYNKPAKNEADDVYNSYLQEETVISDYYHKFEFNNLLFDKVNNFRDDNNNNIFYLINLFFHNINNNFTKKKLNGRERKRNSSFGRWYSF